MASILGVDVGGTFTDFLLWRDGVLTVYKRPSTPQAPAEAVLLGIDESGARPESVVHGSTIATNALIERRGARTALITTRGFGDTLVIGRQTRPRLYDLAPRRPPPLVCDDLRLEANERVAHDGAVLQRLDPREVEALLDQVERLGAESLAVCFLFSFVHDDHERMVAEAARRRGIFVSASHEVLPEPREYERTSTTVVNAYVSPVMTGYLTRLGEGLQQRSVTRLSVVQSSGGSMSPSAAGRLAVRTVLSGPAGGVVGALWLARQAGFDRIITLDMGGTSADVSLCPGRINERDETLIGDVPVRGPTVDVVSVGAGGGSVARIDAGGALHVGPESAGADPGPACFGRGADPTVTDAHLVLGRIVPEHFLGGRLAIDERLSRQALGGIAETFGGDVQRTAAAILAVANANMERALRIVSVERGYDPADFVLVAFGGAGPLHACELAESLRIRRVLVPPSPGVLSALGAVVTAPTKEARAALMVRFAADAAAGADDRLSATFGRLRRAALDELRAEGLLSPESEREAREECILDMRYRGQSYELPVPVERLEPAAIVARFHALHAERYGHSSPSREVEAVIARLRIILPGPPVALPALAAGSADPGGALIGERNAQFGDDVSCAPMYDRPALLAGSRIEGPTIVVQMDATTVVPPGWGGNVDRLGNLVLERGRG